MKIQKVNIDKPDKNVIKHAVNVLINGGIVVYPTDTAYGIGCDATNKSAIKKLYEIKKRDTNKPTHMIVRDINMAGKYCRLNKCGVELIKTFLPGPLTIIFKKKKAIPDMLTANLNTVGIRIPFCNVTRAISSIFARPYTTPSANISGGATPYTINDALCQLDADSLDFVIDAGELKQNTPSTIVSLVDKHYKLLRSGPVSEDEIHKIIKQVTGVSL